jgi:LacI family transcriptional regulator
LSVTIKIVADKAGVSTATVSRVFNDSAPVDDETKKRVVQVAKQLHYTPNWVGRSLSTRRSYAIGLLLPDLYGEFFSEIIRGADETAQKNHYHLLVSSSHNDRQEIEAALQMTRGRVDGLVIMSPGIDAQTLQRNLPHTLPVLLLNCYVRGHSVDSINIDNFGGSYRMINHLLSHGHQRVAMIKGPGRNYDAAERFRGYREALRDSGAKHEAALELEGNFSESSGFDAVRILLKQGGRPDAIFAANDATAVGALSALQEAGVHVPNEIALAGFDDIPIARYLTPALSTVHAGISKLGELAIEKVLHAVRSKNIHEKEQALSPAEVVIRESCGIH